MGQTGGVRARARAALQMTPAAVPTRKHPALRFAVPVGVRGVRKTRAADNKTVSRATTTAEGTVCVTYLVPIDRQDKRAHVPQLWCRPERPDER